MKKITLYLTDATIHNREFREAETLDKTIKRSGDGIEQGRIYMNHSISIDQNGKPVCTFKFPAELQKQIDAGEVEIELIVPESGLPIVLGADAEEKVAQVREAKRLKLARSCRVWKKE